MQDMFERFELNLIRLPRRLGISAGSLSECRNKRDQGEILKSVFIPNQHYPSDDTRWYIIPFPGRKRLIINIYKIYIMKFLPYYFLFHPGI